MHKPASFKLETIKIGYLSVPRLKGEVLPSDRDEGETILNTFCNNSKEIIQLVYNDDPNEEEFAQVFFKSDTDDAVCDDICTALVEVLDGFISGSVKVSISPAGKEVDETVPTEIAFTRKEDPHA